MFELTTRIHFDIPIQFGRMLSIEALCDSNLFGQLSHYVVPDDMPKYLSKVVLSSMSCACDVHRRVVLPCQSFPHKPLWIAVVAEDVECVRRISLAAELLPLLETKEAEICIFSRKVAIIFFRSFVDMAKNWKCGKHLLMYITDLAHC